MSISSVLYQTTLPHRCVPPPKGKRQGVALYEESQDVLAREFKKTLDWMDEARGESLILNYVVHNKGGKRPSVSGLHTAISRALLRAGVVESKELGVGMQSVLSDGVDRVVVQVVGANDVL